MSRFLVVILVLLCSLQICNVFVADELYLALVTSTKAHARIIDVDIKAASAVPGFVTWVDHKDIPGTNNLGWYGDVFAEKEVTNNFIYLLSVWWPDDVATKIYDLWRGTKAILVVGL